MPQRRVYAGETPAPESDEAPEPEDPYKVFIGAFLRRAVDDAAGKITKTGVVVTAAQRASVQHQARLFLQDVEAVSWWVALCNADPAILVPLLQRQAGVEHI